MKNIRPVLASFFSIASAVNNADAQAAQNIQIQPSAYTQALVLQIVNSQQQNFVFASKEQRAVFIISRGQIIYSFPAGFGENRENANSELTNRATPEGQFGTRIASDPQAIRMSGMPVIDFQCNASYTRCASIHSTYLGEFDTRERLLKDGIPDNNDFSNGCINASPENMRIILNFMETHQGNGHVRPYVYVAPVSQQNVNIRFNFY